MCIDLLKSVSISQMSSAGLWKCQPFQTWQSKSVLDVPVQNISMDSISMLP